MIDNLLPIYYIGIASQDFQFDIIEDATFFFIGVILTTITVLIIMALRIKKRRERADEFSKRFVALAEALSSFKALSFQIAEQIRKIRQAYHDKTTINQNDDLDVEDNPEDQDLMNELKEKDLLEVLGGLMYLFENLSAQMIPPTEEIALSALDGKKTALEDKAYQDSVQFREDIRQLKRLLTKHGLDGLSNFKKSAINEVKIG